MSDVVERVAATLREHEGPIFMDGIGTFQCECGFDCNEGASIPPEELWATKSWAAHVAAAVVEALGLTEEWAATLELVEGTVNVATMRSEEAARDLAARSERIKVQSRLASPWVLSVQGSSE